MHKVADAAQKFGMTKTAIIKLATALFVEDWERRGRASLPPNWESILRDQDGRTHRYSSDNAVNIGGNVTGGKITQKKKSTSTSSARGRRGAGKKNKK